MERRQIQVVVAFDFTPSAEAALERAVDVAARAPEHVLHVITAVASGGTVKVDEDQDILYETPADHIHQLVTARIAAAFATRATAEDTKFFVHARVGRPAREILSLAKEVGADLIFIGSEGRVGVGRLLLGSVSEQVVREAHCPVMVVRPKTYEDVELSKIVAYEHERLPYVPPHRYTYTNGVIVRPRDWPLG